MLWELSLTGIKSRFKDYMVLFSGLTFASAIFYMFLTIAINPGFLKESTAAIAFQTTKIVFGVGVVLLAIITLVYITYANSFLLSMRQKDYGMYMMLGSRTSKIGSLIFLETLVVGLLATGLGIIIGIGLAQGVSAVLISQLGLNVNKFVGFYVPAILWTIVFFTGLFFLAALWNRHKLVKSNVIDLLHESQKPVKLKKNVAWNIIEAILGIALLATGYWAMADYMQLQTKSVLIGLVTIVLGSYFVFDSFFTSLIDIFRHNKNFKYKKLHSFTLGQLKFRLTDYTRIITVVSLLFALALGAITVGLNFNNMADQQMEATYYDAILYKQDQAVKNQLKKVSVREKTGFNYKETEKAIYVSKEQIAKDKLMAQESYQKDGQYHFRTVSISKNIEKNQKSESFALAKSQLQGLLPSWDKELKVVSQAQYDQINAKSNYVGLILVNDFKKNFKNIEKLQNLAFIKNGNVDSISYAKASSYRLVLNIASGFEFMGFFLGLAFLAMLASTLMFKVLSGANSDKPRYKMLSKIGTRTSLLKKSIAKEIGLLFAFPAVLGIIDVLFGLQFFKSLLNNPYDKIWIPFGLFLILYFIYYLITVKLYQGIVLKKDN